MANNQNTLRAFFVLLVMTSVMLVCYFEYGGGYQAMVESATVGSDIYEDYDYAEKNISERSNEPMTAPRIAENLPEYPNFPWASYKNRTGGPKYIKKDCAYYPTIEDLDFNNLYWQKTVINGVEFYLYGAYYDNRSMNAKKPTIRILTMTNKVYINTTTTYCQLWFNTKGIATEATWNDYIWIRKWGGQKDSIYQPYLIGCQVPKEFDGQVPVSVSLVGQKCVKATNNLKVHHNIVDVKTDFAVCVKGLDFHDDISIKLIEWIELIQVLGASKIYFYDLHSHDNIQKILQYYTDRGLVEITPTSLPGKYPNNPHIQHKFLRDYTARRRLSEVIPYNDCFYRHMYQHEYIALLDTDEIIMPQVGNWSDLFTVIRKELKVLEKSSYSAQNIYFLDEFLKKPLKDIPSYMHMLQHVNRTRDYTAKGSYMKSFHSTKHVLLLHNHYPFKCLSGCHPYNIPTNMAQLQHYRDGCVSDLKKVCNELKQNVVTDSKVWRFKEILIDRVNKVLTDLDLLPVN